MVPCRHRRSDNRRPMRLPANLGFLILTMLPACAVAPTFGPFAVPPTTTQLLLSTTTDWDSTAATVVRLERTADGWRQVGGPIAARVGRSGLAWGIGLHREGAPGPQKREGDGKAPAGLFTLGPAFGYADTPPPGTSLPYRVATARDYFVDGVDSPDYNSWQHIAADLPNEPGTRWSSCERMRRDDALYEFGVVVGHNMPHAIAGRGSAIFLHVWSGAEGATAGCTAMARQDLLGLLAWLRPDCQPLLLQAPQSALEWLRPGAP